MSMPDLPRIEHVYKNHHLDSTRWDHIPLRPDDIVISTAYKAGTTFTQTIVANLIFWDSPPPEPLLAPSWWIEMRRHPIENVRDDLESQRHRRFLKSHVGLDGIPYREEVRYIFVARDPRDVFMSLWNHYTNHNPELVEQLNGTPGRVGDPFPWPPPDEARTLWRDWISRGWFDWESDGWPYWSLLHHAETWWRFRHLPNILCVHYADLLAELESQVARIASFLGMELPASAIERAAERSRFDSVKKNADRVVGDMSWGFEGGSQTFIHKGTNGRWKGVLDEEDLSLYRRAMGRLPPDLAHWLENGGPVS